MTTDRGLADPASLVVYGRDTCPDTQRTRRHFDLVGVGYRYVSSISRLAPAHGSQLPVTRRRRSW